MINQLSLSSFTLRSTNTWFDWPGLSISVPTNKTNNATIFLVWYQISISGQDSSVLSKLYVDESEKTRTRSIFGKISYGSNYGFWVGPVSSKTIPLKVQYRTPINNQFVDGGDDCQTRSLIVVPLTFATVCYF